MIEPETQKPLRTNSEKLLNGLKIAANIAEILIFVVAVIELFILTHR